MSGKAYSMKEMKVIVEYITHRRAYGDVKGRKMWVEFANSKFTVRTWQSLKETFLKRILPDIHNPYYNLTVDEIRSFREGVNYVQKEQNKLEIVHSDDNSKSNSNAGNQENEQPSTSHAKNGDVESGEDVTSSSKVQTRDRASVDTVIIPTCYETADEVLRDLESPKGVVTNNTNDTKTPTKSLRDLITYSEPLTPMLQEVLHDFATDEDSDSEMRMQIVEEAVPDPESKGEKEESPILVADSDPQVVNEPPIEIFDSEDVANKNDSVQEEDTQDEADSAQPKVLSLKLKKRKGGYKIDKKKKSEKESKNENKEKAEEKNNTETVAPTEQVEESSVICNTNEKQADGNPNTTVAPVPEKPAPSQSNSTDTILPNNQEALDNADNNANKRNSEEQLESDVSKKETAKESKENKTKNNTRKRAISQDVTTTSKVIKSLQETKGKEKAVSDTDTIKKKLKKSENKIEKFRSDNNNKESKDEVSKPISEINEQAHTETNQPKIIEAIEEENNTSIDLSQENPCLRSVSLFAEQFNQVSYVDSDYEQEAETSANKDNEKQNSNKKTKPETEIKKTSVNIKDDVVILKSHSESDSETNQLSPNKKTAPDSLMSKSQRDKVLANVFGFSSGAIGKKRKKGLGGRKHSTYRYPRGHSSDNSSEWTSESDSEAYVSPPRGRRNRQTRKYLKPHSARILSLEEEGGLFVMYGKKIYPLVKDGKIIKNYLSYLPESDGEEEQESYWKLKYVEERQRVEELKKIVEQRQKAERNKSPILPAKSTQYMSPRQDRRPNGISGMEKLHAQSSNTVKAKESENGNDQGKTLKITFAKNDQAVHLEGNWSNIHPVLAEVVQIFNKDSGLKESPADAPVDLTKHLSDASSEKSVAIVPIVDTAVREKVNKLESDIFKEIEERDQEEQSESKENSETNITKRKRGAATKKSQSNQLSVEPKASTSSPRSSKRLKISDIEEKAPTDKDTTEEQKPAKENVRTERKTAEKKPSKTQNKTTVKKASSDQKLVEKKTSANQKVGGKNSSSERNVTETDGKITENNNNDDLSVEAAESKTSVKTRRQTRTPKKDDKEAVTPISNRPSRKSKSVQPSPAKEEEDEIRYMFPPAKKLRTPRSALSLTRSNKRYMTATPKIFTSPLQLQSETTHGYQDSDISPPKALLRRKRKLSLTTALTKIRHRSFRNKRKSYPIITDDISSDSNSSYHMVVRPISQESSLKSEAYKSESYQCLFPQNKHSFRALEKIDEVSTIINVNKVSKTGGQWKTSTMRQVYSKPVDINMNNDFVNSNGTSDGGNSSNVSLPLSPEISIVENLSISKELLNSMTMSHPNLNEIQASHTVGTEINDKYMISQVDVSMPLMEQHCNFFPCLNAIKVENDEETRPASDSLSNNIVNSGDAPSISDSLDTRLKNLLLESAKKMSMEYEETNDKNAKEIQKKPKTGKRCSTPRKKRGVQKKKLALTKPVVEEECTESFSRGGRNSCPPAIQLITTDNIARKENIDANVTPSKEKSKVRRKKDVIKVKILRPRSKTRKRDDTKNKKEDTIVNNDSGINETDSVMSNLGINESIDLIHNHSETCMHAIECMADEDSVKFIDNLGRSIISLNTDSTSISDRTDRSYRDRIVFKDCEDFPELFCQNAQDWTVNNVQVQPPTKTNTEVTSETEYHSPILSDTSLITEDLSDEHPQSQPTKWYLLSEDETQTASANCPDPNASTSGFGANLKQIFPITCAVPDLSTITEQSENSRKPTLESDVSTRQCLD